MTNAAAPIPINHAALRADPAAARIIRDFRRLTSTQEGGGNGGRGGWGLNGGRTLVACSAGANSTALLVTLAAHTDNLVAAHIRHDMRPREETDLDLAFLRDLSAALDIPFTTVDISIPPGNAEASARKARYAALSQLAEHHACPFIAAGHHADDLLETQIMALLRGAALRGLASLRPTRRLSDRVILIRPMLAITRDDARRLCDLAGVTPIEDRTNTDTTRLRAALRAGVLAERAPRAARRAGATAALFRDAQRVVADRARETQPENGVWNRDILARERTIVIIEAIRGEFRRQTLGVGLDALSRRALAPVVRAIRDGSNEPRVFMLASRVRIEVGGTEVRMSRAAEGSGHP